MKFKQGDKVMAKWPGTSLYFHATIKQIDEKDPYGLVDMRYEDGTEMGIPIEYIRTEASFRKRITKSSARRRSRSRSPARTPSRPSCLKKTVQKSPKKSTKSSISKTSTTSSSSEDAKTGRATVEKTIRFDTTATERKVGFEKVTTKNYQAGIFEEKSLGANNMSSRSADAAVAAARETTSRHKYEFGGPFGVFFQYIFTPVAIVALVSSYKATNCELLKFKLADISLDPTSYFDPRASLIVLEFLLFHAILYAIPLGQTLEGPRTYSGRKTEYRLSAFFTMLFTVLGYSALLYLSYPVMIVYDKTLQLASTSCVLSFIFNILLHIKSYFAEEDELNPGANTGWTIYDAFMGRELHPKFGRYYHLKLLVYRPAMTGWILVTLVYLQKELATTGAVRPSVAIVAGFQIVYCLMCFFWDEGQVLYSFDIKNEGLGFQNLIGNLAIVPFIYTMHTRYLIDHPNSPLVPLPLLVTAVVALVLGLALVVLSNYQKMHFRQNPYNPNLAALDSIPPSKKDGRRLIVSGYWGFVRHPNYLGEILLGLGYGLLCGFSDIFPWVFLLFIGGLLAHRAMRDEARCKEAHGYAWSEYCRRVPYRIIPYVF